MRRQQNIKNPLSAASLANSQSLQGVFCHGGLQVHLCTCFLPNLMKFCSASCFSLFFLSWFIFPYLLVLFYFRVFYPSFVSEYSLFIFCPSFSLRVQFYFYVLPHFFSNPSVSLFTQLISSLFFWLLFNYSSTSSSSFLFHSVLLIFPCCLQHWYIL